MNPRRVLHVLRSVEGGVPVVVDQLARGLDRSQYEPIVLFDTHLQSDIRKKLSESDIKTIDLKKCLTDHVATQIKPRKNIDISGRIQSHFGREANRIYLSFRTFFLFLWKEAPKIKAYLIVFQENGVDLVHTHSNLFHGKPEIVAARMANIPCISHNHGYGKFNHFDRMFSRYVNEFINISRDVAKHHTSQVKSRVRGTIIHNGIYMRKFTQPYDSNSVRDELGIKPYQNLVGIVGRIDWWKGHEYFLKAMARVMEHIPDLRGLIIGDLEKNVATDRNRKYFNNLQLMVKSLSLSDKIIFTGSKSDIPRLIAALDVVVHASSIPEPFGLVIIEAMASGKPVVATAAGGVLDIIEDGKNGILVPCKDAESMAVAIMQILFDQDRAKQVGIAARRRVAEKFTVQHQVTAVQKLYDSTLANHQRLKSK